MRNQISTLLNTDVAGRYIFSGTRTDVPPIIDKPLPAPLTLGVPDTTYYQGSNQDITTRISENSDMTYNVRADASGFQKIYAGVAHALDGHARNNDTVLQESFNLLRQGIDEVIATQTEVNANRITLEETNTHHLSLKLYFQSVTEDIANTDILAATTQSATDRAVLQASFQIFAKLNNLRLSDFL
jgi:flagellar hook-associated protein 3 FlgL